MTIVNVTAVVRRGPDAQRAADYLARALTDAGASVSSATSAARKRGGRAQVLAEADDAVAVMGAVRAKLDGDTNRYAADLLDEIHIVAFRDEGGGILGFAMEDYRTCRS